MYATENTLDKLMSGDVDTITALLEGYKRTALELKQATTKIEEDRPKVEFHDAVHDSTNLMSIKEFGKAVGIGEKKLFSALRAMGIFYYDKKTNLPYQEYINRGYFKVIEGTYNNRVGGITTYLTTKITGKGQTWLENKINR